MQGWVYLLGINGDDAMYKIGVTKAKDINKRIAKLQTGNGNEIRLVASFRANKPFKLETALHNHFAMSRQTGEWFLLTQEQVSSFIPLCERFERNITTADSPLDLLLP